MADENTTAEDLIAEIREAASDFAVGRTYSPAARRVPAVKVLDFIFWSAGKVGLPKP